MEVRKEEPEQHYLPLDTLQSEHKYEKAKIPVQTDKLNLVREDKRPGSYFIAKSTHLSQTSL